jgi:hypothetical protein
MLNEGMTSAIPDVCDDGRYRYITGTWIMASDDGLTWRQYSDGPVVCHGDVAVLFADHESSRYLLYNKFGAQHGLHHRRSFMGLESTDAIHWVGYNGDALKSRYCFMADDYDDLIATQRGLMITDYYGVTLHRTGDLYVAAESMFHMTLPLNMRSGQNADGLGYVRLAYSNDGFHWRHPKGRPGWLEYGKPGEFDAGFIVTANTFTEHGDDLLMYYGGSRDFHGWCINEQFQMRPDIPLEEQRNMASIGAVARIKRDRFASLSCTWRGNFVVESTAPAGRDNLYINALCGQGGSVRVAIYDGDGVELKGNNRWDFKPLPGFSLDDCIPVTGDVMRAPIQFRNAHVGSLPADKPVFLQFELFRSEIFAFEWDAEKS